MTYADPEELIKIEDMAIEKRMKKQSSKKKK